VITQYRRAHIHHLVQSQGWTVEGDSVALSKTADCICANQFGLVIESLVGRCQDQQAGLGRRCLRAVGL